MTFLQFKVDPFIKHCFTEYRLDLSKEDLDVDKWKETMLRNDCQEYVEIYKDTIRENVKLVIDSANMKANKNSLKNIKLYCETGKEEYLKKITEPHYSLYKKSKYEDVKIVKNFLTCFEAKHTSASTRRGDLQNNL